MMNYTTLLKEYNLKVTPQRVAIVEELYANGHMNIDDLYKKLLAKFPSISLATIYKNVNAMIEKVFLNEVKIPNSKSVYELVKDEHSHLVCSSCGKIEDLDLNVSSLIEEATTLKNYTIKQSSVVFTGLCPNCSK
ncbi:transcriptional repressor [Malaciobacter molluscorum LMG 25693]|uniref:Peroxide stress transcriptional regulator PerR n=1 Tax=Malaciobacter molluscorum LMG 25693 TaxID=870501 RepID=A0A2G1DEX4_9BACT|nr:transcriptional repressor [Malaciobacter molluscorum]AXX92804.1 peroxide stress transcriptional regulator PerR [Malaciobacter molluscorum LMG 25693]PHO17004.1 transcriptional repressor [Malaciobacter molluscorum LMG 25693]RXJ96131.1 transcriptional repressor [Malaciobacter molluscorum]